MLRFHKWSITCLSTALLTACGGGTEDTESVAAVPVAASGVTAASTATGKNALVTMVTEAPGAHCSAGGTQVQGGQDTNANGVLDAGEVSVTQYLCNGTTGATGATGAAGTAGADGAAGVGGAAGANGHSSRLTIATEPAGTHCANGGTAVVSWLDINDNGVFDSGVDTASAPSYVCTGAAGASVSSAPVSISAATQALPNTAYVASSAASAVALTLPSSQGLPPGTVLSIAGAGAGRWSLAQNADQSILTGNIASTLVTPRWAISNSLTATQGKLYDMASSSNGSAVYLASDKGLSRSYDGGLSYKLVYTTSSPLVSVAASADGNTVIAALGGTTPGALVGSTDGDTIRKMASGPSAAAPWTSVSASGDGTRMAAISGGDPKIYVSSDSGATWTSVTPKNASGALTAVGWNGVSISADGSSIAAFTSDTTPKFAKSAWSALSGNWSGLMPSGGGVITAVSAGKDGSAVMYGTSTGIAGTAYGASSSYYSVFTDTGVTSLSSSADGSVTVAASAKGNISKFNGSKWSDLSPSPTAWPSSSAFAAVSGSGQNFFAATSDTSQTAVAFFGRTTPGTAGSISGGWGDSVTVQYLGGGIFILLNFNNNSGSLTVN